MKGSFIILIVFPIALLLLFIAFIFLYPKLKTPEEQTLNAAFTLDISSPEDGEYTVTSVTKIVGKTLPGTLLGIYSHTSYEVGQAKDDGLFSVNLELAEGLNEITIVAQNEEGIEKRETRDVFFDPKEELLEGTKSAKPAPKESTESAIQELKERILRERERQKIKVYAGSIKNILGKNLTISTKIGAKTAKITSISAILKDGKIIKPEEIQVENYAIALGRVDSSGLEVLNLRIFSIQRSVANRQAVFGIVSNVNEKEIIIVNQTNGQETKLLIDSGSQIMSSQGQKTILDIEVANRLVAIATQEKDGLLIKKVYVDKKKYDEVLSRFTKTASPSAQLQESTKSATSSSR